MHKILSGSWWPESVLLCMFLSLLVLLLPSAWLIPRQKKGSFLWSSWIVQFFSKHSGFAIFYVTSLHFPGWNIVVDSISRIPFAYNLRRVHYLQIWKVEEKGQLSSCRLSLPHSRLLPLLLQTAVSFPEHVRIWLHDKLFGPTVVPQARTLGCLPWHLFPQCFPQAL